MNDNRQYLNLSNEMEEAIKGFSGFQQIDQFLDRISHRLEGIDLYGSDNWEDLSEIREFLRDVPQFESGEDLVSDYNECGSWSSQAMIDLFVSCATDSERNKGLTSWDGAHCHYTFNNSDDWDHTSMITYESESEWIEDLIDATVTAIKDRLNVFYMCTENITDKEIKEDLETVEKWINDYFYSSFEEEDEQEAQADRD